MITWVSPSWLDSVLTLLSGPKDCCPPLPITQGSALYIFFGQQTLKSPITSLCAQPQPNPSRAGSSTWSIPLAFVGTSGCSSWSWVGITACCKQTTPGSGNRESPGLALCRDSYNPAFARADNHSCSCTPQEGKLGLHQQLSQGKVGSAHTEHQSLWLSSGCLEHHRPARLEQEWGRDLLSSPSAAALRLCPPSPGSETHSSHLRKPWTNILSRETTGRWGTGEDKQQLLCCTDFTTAFSHLTIPRRAQGWVRTETVQVPGR